MRITNTLNLPEAFLDAVVYDDYDPGESDITVTGLILPPQIAYLRRKHWDEITEDVSERLFVLGGKAIHYVLEKARSNDIREKRVYAEIDGWKVGGQLDNLCLWKGLLSDYKWTSVYAVLGDVKPEWEQQLNILCFLFVKNNYLNINRLEIVALLRDWSKARALQNKDWPQTATCRVPVKRWSVEEQLLFLHNRVELHQTARIEGLYPLCTDEERWASPQKWAVMKKGNKRATKLCGSMEEAEEFIAGHKEEKKLSIEERPRQYRRCEDYCNALPWCVQAKDIWEAKQNEGIA